jgi:hypothetical protein
VHYARTMLLDASTPNLQPRENTTDSFVIAVITEYDGSFDDYIGDFVSQVGAVFDALLQYVVDGAKLIPVVNNVQAFSNFINLNDASQHLPNTGLFQAYDFDVQKILADA